MNKSMRTLEAHFELKDDLELLNMMLTDSKSQSSLYNPGPYWVTKTINAANEIKRCGIANFRGSTNLIGYSFSDNLYIDIRNTYNHGLRRLIRWMMKTYPLSKIYEAQVQMTKSYAIENIAFAQEIINKNEKTRKLLEKYTIPYSLLGGCLRKVIIDGYDYSIHYLDLLERHDNISSRIKFTDARSIFEIGGGIWS